MHIMFVPSWYENPRNKVHGSFFREQAMALQESGVKITVAYNEIWPLTMIRNNTEKSGMFYNIENGLETFRYKNYNFIPKSHLMFNQFNKRMEKLFLEVQQKRGKVHVIHAQSSFWAGISAAYVAEKYNIPLIITEHSSIKHAIYIKESYKEHIKRSYLAADALIAVGNGLKSELESFCGRKDISVIHNILNVSNFKVKPNKIKEDFTVFSLAFLEGEKGMDTLIRSFAKAFKDTDAILRIGGDGSQRPWLESIAKAEGVADKVEFLGSLSREQVAEEMANCNLFALLSRNETFGVVYIEALASGRPIIGTLNGGAEEIITDVNGLIFKIDDIDEIAKGLVYIKENISKYDEEEIKKDFEFRFSRNKIIEEIRGVYNEVVR